MTLPHNGSSQSLERWGHVAVAVVLVMAFVTGGGSRDRGLGDVATQFLALPLGLWAIFALSTTPGTWVRRTALAVSAMVVGTLVLQQLPLSEGLWRMIAVRDALARDMEVASVDAVRHTWSLSPLASERALWSILPALAVFLAALVVPVRHHRNLLLLVVGLCTLSLMLGFLQLGAPQDSVLNPFPEWPAALNGVFSNPNHQATGLAVSIVILVALFVAGRDSESTSALPRWVLFGMVALAVLLFAALPLTGSRAVLLIAVLGLVAVLAILRPRRTSPRSSALPGATAGATSRAIQIMLGVLSIGVISAAVGWMRHDIAEESRWLVAKVTAAMGWDHSMLGAGVGSFVPWFEQAAPADLVRRTYFNHAHNEYAQWWFESSVLGVASLMAVVVMLLVCFPGRQTRRVGGDRGVAVAAWLGCGVMLLHSLVDFPMRTPALMTLAGLLAGIVVAQRCAQIPHSDVRSVTTGALQRA